MDPAEIKRRLLAEFPDARCELIDLTGTSDHYELHIASDVFRGLSPIRQHRLVYQAIGQDVGTAIHALALKTYLPEAWTRST